MFDYCYLIANYRTDESTIQHLSKLGRSPVVPDQALSIGVEINARNYLETAAAVSYVETYELFSLSAVAALEFRRLHQPAPEPAPVAAGHRPSSVMSHHSGHMAHHDSMSHHMGPHDTGIRQSSSQQYCGSQSSLQSQNSQTRTRPGHSHTASVPTSPNKTASPHNDHHQPVHFRSSSQPVRSCLDLNTRMSSHPHSPPPPRPNRSHMSVASPSSSSCHSEPVTDNPELRKQGAILSRKPSFRSSMPVAMGKPPLPSSAIPKSPTDLLQLSSQRPAAGHPVITTEPSKSKSRLTQLGLPEGKNYESLKSHTSTVSHGSTGSKMSSTSSQLSAQVLMR